MKSNISADPALDTGQIAAVRGFSRFYTRKLGIIEPKLLDSPWTLQEARIIYEIAERRDLHRDRPRSARSVSMPAILSRTLQALQRRQIVARKPSKADRRVTELSTDRQGPRGLCRSRQPVAPARSRRCWRQLDERRARQLSSAP